MSTEPFPVVILAGGLASRLGALTRNMPKVLLDVHGEPFVFHQLRLLKNKGIRDVMLCIGHLGEQVVRAVGDGQAFGLNVRYSWDGPRLVGSAGAIKKAISLLNLQTFFVMYGDSYLECDFAAVQTAFESAGRLGLMTVFRNDGRLAPSNVEFANGRILNYDKNDPSAQMHHIDYGLGVYSERAFDGVAEDKSVDLVSVVQDLLAKGQLAGLEVFQRFYEIGSPAGLEETRQHLAGK